VTKESLFTKKHDCTFMATSAAKLRRFGSTRETDDGVVSDDKTLTFHNTIKSTATST